MSEPDRAPRAPLDADTLRRDYAANWDNRLQAIALGLLAAAAALYPAVIHAAVEWLGLRPVATMLALGAAASSLRPSTSASRVARIGTGVLAAIAAVASSMLPLMLLAGAIHGALAYLFLASLRDDRSIVERAAKLIQPAAPDFIGPYCRRVTLLWGMVFAINAGMLTEIALTLPVDVWQRAAGVWVWSWMAVVTAAEFLVRKTYFRNYWYRGPFERLWSRLFPADATPMGRRSAAHIREVRAKLGLDD